MDPLTLLAKARIDVSPETFSIVSLGKEDWERLLKNPELSPRMMTPFLIFKDKWEVTLILGQADFELIRDEVSKARIERNFRLLSFDVELDFDAVGFIAEIARIFAEARISILPFSSFSRDHVFIRQVELPNALKALRGYVEEIC